MAKDAVEVLEEAEKARSMIRPSALTEYVQAWRSDRKVWHKHVQEFNSVGTLNDALGKLGLLGSALSTEPAQGRRSRNGRTSDVARGGVSSGGPHKTDECGEEVPDALVGGLPTAEGSVCGVPAAEESVSPLSPDGTA